MSILAGDKDHWDKYRLSKLNLHFQSQETTEKKNARLLDLMLLRNDGALTKFCDVLQLSGHNFLADLLRDEGTDGDNSAHLMFKFIFLRIRTNMLSTYC